MSSRDLAIVQPPAGARGAYRFTLRRNGTKAWPLLQWRHQDRRITLRMPKTTSLSEALAAFDTRVPWFEAFIVPRRRPKASPTLWIDGQSVRAVHAPNYPNTPTIEGGTLLLRSAPLAQMQKTVGQFIWERTQTAMEQHAADKAALLGKALGRVWLSNAMRKWGACDARNNINFSWRLSMAPPLVQEYLAAHEVAHFIHRHHKDAFWAQVTELMPGWAAPEHWLTFKGGALMGWRLDQLLPDDSAAIGAAQPLLML
ncbi:MAG: YgjP-like metallopeptidase domain-containing protein [Pseudomonadota bacterium]